MGAALAALAVLAAVPASAGFRYVAPASVAHGAAGPEADRIGENAGAPAHGAGRAAWRIHAGETLRTALTRWGARAGADVVFLTDRRYRLDAAAAFEGAFRDAVQTLLRGLAHLPHPPAGALSRDSTSLVVTHRTRRPPEGEAKP